MSRKLTPIASTSTSSRPGPGSGSGSSRGSSTSGPPFCVTTIARKSLSSRVWWTAREINAIAARGSAGGRVPDRPGVCQDSGVPAFASGWVPILQVDAELAARVPAATLAAAGPLALAQAEWLEPGEWYPRAPDDSERSAHMGLLVVDGFFARRVH